MAQFGFNPFGTDSISVKFNCNECGSRVVSDDIGVPSPDYSADTASGSEAQSNDYARCEQCGKNYFVEIYVTYAGAYGIVNDLPDSATVFVHEGMSLFDDEMYWEMASSQQLTILHEHLKNAEDLLSSEVCLQLRSSLLVMLYAHVVAAMEQFLCSTFIHKVTNSEDLMRKLIETDPELGKRSFTLNEIFEQSTKLKSTVGIYLDSVIFHNLHKVKPMYKSVLGCDFGDIKWLFKAVNVRHDCAHRAGYDKEGNKVILTHSNLNDLIERCRAFAEKVHLDTVRYE